MKVSTVQLLAFLALPNIINCTSLSSTIIFGFDSIGMSTIAMSSIGSKDELTSYIVECPSSEFCSLDILSNSATLTVGSTTQMLTVSFQGITMGYECSYLGTETATCFESQARFGQSTTAIATFASGQVPVMPVIFQEQATAAVDVRATAAAALPSSATTPVTVTSSSRVQETGVVVATSSQDIGNTAKSTDNAIANLTSSVKDNGGVYVVMPVISILLGCVAFIIFS